MRTARSTSSMPPCCSTSIKPSPTSRSITRNGGPCLGTTKSVTSTMCGWPSMAAAIASRRKRSRMVGSLASSGASTLSATRRPSSTCTAS